MQIIVKNKFEGYHLWRDAPEEVAFLRSPHRHLFYVETRIRVKEDDRELEFFMVQHRINQIIKEEMPLTLESAQLGLSCEMMAKKILGRLRWLYPNRPISCLITEDDENGAIVEMDATGSWS